jgi:catechol 2,3-dioxygenase-like lactoylglutathione lyase family enzyme
MKSSLSHIQIVIDFKHISFYKEFLGFLGWKEIYSDDQFAGFGFGGGETDGSIWFSHTEHKEKQNYDLIGMNHVGIGVTEQEDVDAVVTYLKERSIPTLFETPRHRTEFSEGENTYYQVMFHTPDEILFEVVYTGKKK